VRLLADSVEPDSVEEDETTTISAGVAGEAQRAVIRPSRAIGAAVAPVLYQHLAVGRVEVGIDPRDRIAETGAPRPVGEKEIETGGLLLLEEIATGLDIRLHEAGLGRAQHQGGQRDVGRCPGHDLAHDPTIVADDPAKRQNCKFLAAFMSLHLPKYS